MRLACLLCEQCRLHGLRAAQKQHRGGTGEQGAGTGGEARRCGACVWRAPLAPQLIASRAAGEDDGLSWSVAVCLQSLPSWRAERRCRGSILRPALCVGCKELAIRTLCELQPGAEGGRSSAQGAALGERRAARGEVPGTGGAGGLAVGRGQARGECKHDPHAKNATRDRRVRVASGTQEARSRADAGELQARTREERRARETALVASTSVQRKVFQEADA